MSASKTTGKRSRAALKAFLATAETADDPVPPDPRAQDLRTSRAEDPQIRQAIAAVFAGMDLPDNETKVGRLLQARREILAEWGRARDSFLAIGRALLALERDLTRAEFARLRQESERILPFSDATATQLRQIARAVDGGRIQAANCPASYGTAYQITLLTDRQMNVARERGLLRPDVTRREIMALRREIPRPHTRGRPDNFAALEAERAHLLTRHQDLTHELLRIQDRIRRIDAELG